MKLQTIKPFSKRLNKFRAELGYSQRQFAELLGVTYAAIIRWENGTARPTSENVLALQKIGFGSVHEKETNKSSVSRLDRNDIADLRLAIQKKIKIQGKKYPFEPSPYVLNGPENQIKFFSNLLELQETDYLDQKDKLPIKRLSLIRDVKQTKTAQYELEEPKDNARSWNSNYGTHGWHRYVGRFPPHLVRALINSFKLKTGDVLLDPFLGSGTSLVEARLLGINGFGLDICPLSTLISKAKTQFPSNINPLVTLVEDYKNFYQGRLNKFLQKSKNFIHEDVIKRNGNLISPFANYEKWFTPEALLGASITVEFISQLKGYQRDFMACQFSSVMRSIGNVEVNVVRAEYSKKPRENVDVLSLVSKRANKSIRSIEKSLKTHSCFLAKQPNIKIDNCGIQNANIFNGSIDAIITSPPYGVETISYLRTHLLSYRCLEPIINYDPYKENQNIIGSEYAHKPLNIKHIASEKSPTYEAFFSQYSQNNCPRKIWQRVEMMMKFFDDMALAAELMAKWLKRKGKIAFVIGNKKLGDRVIPTHTIIAEIFATYGLKEINAIKHKLKTNNSNSQVPWQDKIIQDEYILIYEKQ